MSKRAIAYFAGGVAALALIAPGAAQAAPGMTKVTAPHATVVEKVADRSKARSGARGTKGSRVYGYGPRTYGYNPAPKANPSSGLPFSYGMAQPDETEFGSNAWWRSMKSTGHIR
jgi:hypothetical protein